MPAREHTITCREPFPPSCRLDLSAINATSRGQPSFSFGVNLLTLAIPLYTIQVYDRVLSSGSGATLTVLTIAVLGGMVTSAMLEDIRARLLVALGVNFDSQLATQLFERQIEVALSAGRGSNNSRSRYGPACGDGQRHTLSL